MRRDNSGKTRHERTPERGFTPGPKPGNRYTIANMAIIISTLQHHELHYLYPPADGVPVYHSHPDLPTGDTGVPPAITC